MPSPDFTVTELNAVREARYDSGYFSHLTPSSHSLGMESLTDRCGILVRKALRDCVYSYCGLSFIELIDGMSRRSIAHRFGVTHSALSRQLTKGNPKLILSFIEALWQERCWGSMPLPKTQEVNHVIFTACMSLVLPALKAAGQSCWLPELPSLLTQAEVEVLESASINEKILSALLASQGAGGHSQRRHQFVDAWRLFFQQRFPEEWSLDPRFGVGTPDDVIPAVCKFHEEWRFVLAWTHTLLARVEYPKSPVSIVMDKTPNDSAKHTQSPKGVVQ